jgi:hypothetical protein
MYKKGDLVSITADLFDPPSIGLIYNKERRKVKYVIDPRVPELDKVKEEDHYGIWVFGLREVVWYTEDQINLISQVK